jgi:TraM recognition site of TraD and TraG
MSGWSSIFGADTQAKPQVGPVLDLGTTGKGLHRRRVLLSPAQAARHRHVLGISGFGKSKLLANIFIQLFLQLVTGSVFVIDPHRDLLVEILGLLHDAGYFNYRHAYSKLLLIDFSRDDRYVPWDVLQQPYNAHKVARMIVETCERMWPALADGAGPLFETIMLNGVVLLVANQLPITAMLRLLTDDEFRRGLLLHCDDWQVVHFWRERFAAWGREQPLMVESCARRVQLLTFDPALRYSLGQAANVLNFRTMMANRTSFLANLAGLDPQAKKFVGCLLNVGIEEAAMDREHIPAAERYPVHVIIDEFAQFCSTSQEALATYLSQTRKYNVFLTLAHQTFDQLSDRLKGAVQNCQHIAFQLGPEDSKWSAERFLTFDPLAIKHEVRDPDQLDRSHPVYLSAPEQLLTIATRIQHLPPGEAMIRLDGRTVHLRTKRVTTPHCTREEYQAIADRYAQLLQRPAALVRDEVDGQLQRTGEPRLTRRTPRRADITGD